MKSRERLPLGQISERELDVAYLVGEGLDNKDIAQALHIAWKTVACHIQNIYRQLGIYQGNPRVMLARWVWERQALELLGKSRRAQQKRF